MVNSERPGVYAAYEVSSAVSGAANGGVVGIAARAENGTAGECGIVGTYAEACTEYGADSRMAELVRLALKNGASSVRAVPAAVGQEPGTEAYGSAFETLCALDDVKIIICDSAAAAVHGALADALAEAAEERRYMIGVVEGHGTVAQLTTAAAAINCERMVMCAPGAVDISGDDAVCGSAAAAVAGAVASQSDPALPLNGAALFGLYGIGASYSDSDITTLVRGGVTPLESSGGAICVVRGITTRTSTSGAADSTWRELTTTLIVDDVIPSVRDALRSRFARAKNTARTRGAIRTQVVIELENKLAREIIESYDNVTVAVNSDDPTVCEVGFDFTVAHGLNQIRLSAHITV